MRRPPRSVALVSATIIGLAACAPSGGPGGGDASASTPASAGAGAGEFTNPVIAENFPDPHILRVGDTYYAYATGSANANIQVARSADLVSWELLSDALPELPLWQIASQSRTWAPEVAQLGDRFVMHYTGGNVAIGRQCLSVAVADQPEGPFVDDSEEPLVCQEELGGSIDSHVFVDADGSPYLFWKNDGNCCNQVTEIFAAPLSPDGLTLLGEPVRVGAENSQAWEGHVIEAPTVVLHEGTYYLFFSANDYASSDYAVGYATADTVTGPYADAEENPILATRPPAAGPGHQTVIAGPNGDLWMAYHAWDIDAIGDAAGGRRRVWIDRLTFEDGRPIVHGPTADPQARP